MEGMEGKREVKECTPNTTFPSTLSFTLPHLAPNPPVPTSTAAASPLPPAFAPSAGRPPSRFRPHLRPHFHTSHPTQPTHLCQHQLQQPPSSRQHLRRPLGAHLHTSVHTSVHASTPRTPLTCANISRSSLAPPASACARLFTGPHPATSISCSRAGQLPTSSSR